jgi:hypothetical protein
VSGDREALLLGAPASEVSLASLETRSARQRARGSVNAALRRGLFGTRFGPAFYVGFTSERAGLVPVTLAVEDEPRAGPENAGNPSTDGNGSSKRKTAGAALLVGAAAAGVAAGVFVGLTVAARDDYASTEYERQADEARNRFNRFQALAWASAGAAFVLGGTGAMLLLWPDPAVSPASGLKSALVPAGVSLHGSF